MLGHTDYIGEFQSEWNARLKVPCETKPPIKKFSSYELAHGYGEFLGYEQGARDLTRKNFRDVIARAGLSALAYGVSATDWKELVPDLMAAGPEFSVFSIAIRYGCEVAKSAGSQVCFCVDAGVAHRIDVERAFLLRSDLAGIPPGAAQLTVAPVLGNPGLQAADLVAHETYQFLRDLRLKGVRDPSAHLRRLQEGAYDFRVAFLGRREIQDMLDKTFGAAR